MPMATDPAAYPQGAENIHQDADPEPQRGRGSTRSNKLAAPLRIPKNRSTGNLAVVAEFPERGRLRFSFDAGSGVTESDQITRSPIITEHDHGLGISGLRRIRQHPTPRTPTMPSSAVSSRSASAGIPRSTSMSVMLPSGHHTPLLGPSSPNFSEDLSRFPSESLHSFSFAHQSEEFIHNRQNVLKRSIEFMKDRMGWAVSSNAAMASAQARVSGDVETQHMLDLLARAQLVGAGNLPNTDSSIISGPLTGPAQIPQGNVFEKDFIPRTSSPESFITPHVSPMARVPAADQVPAATAQPRRSEEGESALKQADATQEQPDSENSSRTPTNESGTTAKTSPPVSRRPSLKRTFTDLGSAEKEQKLIDTMAQPFLAGSSESYSEALVSPMLPPLAMGSSLSSAGSLGPVVHGHAARWVPAAQAIFTTESKPPWTILAANDLACLVFGVTKAEVRKMGILEVVQEERRAWLENKLLRAGPEDVGQTPAQTEPQPAPSVGSSLLGGRGGITAQLLSKPNSRSQPPKNPARRAQTVHSGDTTPSKSRGTSHRNSKSRGVLLCGDVVPIQKRNGATGSASLWVKEKRVGLIWVLEEIHEDVAFVSLDDDGVVTKISGDTGPIWGDENLQPGMDIGKLIPRIPRQGIDPRYGAIDYAQIAKRRYFTCRNGGKVNIPAIVAQTRGQAELRVSSFPHIAGIIVVAPDTLRIKSSNSAFCGALFGYEKPEGQSITNLIPHFDKVLEILVDHEGIHLQDGIVVPEHSFRKASTLLTLQDGKPDPTSDFLNPNGLPAKHRDGSELKIDVQMRVVKSEKHSGNDSGTSDDESQSSDIESEMVYALWITYSRHLHASNIKSSAAAGSKSPMLSGAVSPLHQPSPGQTPAHTPMDMSSDTEDTKSRPNSAASGLSQQLKVAAINAATKVAGGLSTNSEKESSSPPPQNDAPPRKKTIDDFVILEDMGQGAYGQVKLARYKYNGGKKVVLKYVTKRRILVDTWTRDRRLGTVPLEIHVLDYLRRDGLKHPNIVEMEDFFEDDINYYIEMAPHGYPGMDLFDYIELRANMEEDECRSIFVQVARAIHHLHIKAKVVHRDIKDENVILDGEGNIKLIDFGSAAYIKSGPFDVFVGTIDYAAPEVLAGKPYGGKEQDVWALGILLYTIIYKENPFYSIDEIMDRDLRVPYVISEESINLIRCMLDRDLTRRYDIEQVLQHPWCQMD
ncbi:Pkinase-domain-containing protein [Daldinia eschscholtzii]|nr:Pkinase-domain-containing protein [Daldinia eschscholtzii]